MTTLIHQFMAAADRFPDRSAIIEDHRQITYGALNEAIGSLSSWLDAQGIEPGDRVGIHLVNSIEYVIAYYGCWALGAVPVALNTLATSRELSTWIDNSGCRMIFTGKGLPASIETAQCLITWEESGRLAIDDQTIESAGSSTLLPEADSVATIIYTSGTTGAPKGITLTHRNLAANIQGIQQSLSIDSDDVFLCVLPFFYSFGNSVLHSHLSSGATLVLFNHSGYPREILQRMEDFRCTGFAGVPSLYIALLKKADFTAHDLSHLRCLTQAGGPLSEEFITQITELLPEVSFHVMYGQTEASARIACLPPDQLKQKMGSVGLPLAGIEIKVVDAQGEQCKPFEQGEICLKGDNVMQGYWNNEELTCQVLRDGFLHTGDQGYLDDEGFLYIIGRQSELLKISEHRVSPYEIEEVILQLEAIDECAVIGCPHEQMGQAAKAFVVASDTDLKEIQIKKHCKGLLASYKIPKWIEFVDQLPKTSSGKIKRSELSC